VKVEAMQAKLACRSTKCLMTSSRGNLIVEMAVSNLPLAKIVSIVIRNTQHNFNRIVICFWRQI